uniref:Uncharacterized protein n=1 Tax=Arundo donax TaxID=35708 RepID=A0A0A8ZKU6_ARUDO
MIEEMKKLVVSLDEGPRKWLDDHRPEIYKWARAFNR